MLEGFFGKTCAGSICTITRDPCLNGGYDYISIQHCKSHYSSENVLRVLSSTIPATARRPSMEIDVNCSHVALEGQGRILYPIFHIRRENSVHIQYKLAQRQASVFLKYEQLKE